MHWTYVKKYKYMFAFLSFLNTQMAQIVEIIPCDK